MAMSSNSGLSDDTKTIITILLLIFIFPVGLILMWVWTNWKKWIKWLITIPVIVGFVGVLFGILSTANPSVQLQKGRCMKECDKILNETGKSACEEECFKLK